MYCVFLILVLRFCLLTLGISLSVVSHIVDLDLFKLVNSLTKGFIDFLNQVLQSGIRSHLRDYDDDEASNHEDASDIGAALKQQQPVIPQITAISNIKLLILKKEEYDIRLEAHGAEVSTEDANHKFLRSLPPAWSNLAMTMRIILIRWTLYLLMICTITLEFLSRKSKVPQKHLQVLKMLLLFHKAKAALIRLSLVLLVPTVLANSRLILHPIFRKRSSAGFADDSYLFLFAKQSEDGTCFMKT
ncbi:hypothetical protein Tco_1030549 [Tanacetum coccineum]|uniref:Uncharacterized protein n=1 Tax=Tanacetum coccineum TaxID=301880 RepID=A0ABQ5G6J4_9ASTR